MAALWAPESMNWRILASLSQAVMVQKVRCSSGRSAPARNPGARLTWFWERMAWRKKKGRKRMERMRRRVREMKGIQGQFTVVSFQLSGVGERKGSY
jgi:hypothetical protein